MATAKSSAKPLSSRVLYRKYRPTSLESVVGQEQVTTTLTNSLKQDRIAHAYLFIGPRGTGKTSVARIFAHAVNGFDYQLEDSYLDIIEIDAASNTGVDNIRELREKAIIAPTKGKYKVYIIDEVHMLTKSAANALLKTLEEPPEHVIFIMATTDAHKVPITISSRTQVHTFRLADPEIMFQHLKHIAELEQIPIEDDALRLIVRRGGGSFRDSLSVLDQIMNLSDQTITANLLEQALGLPQEQALSNLLSAYASRDSATIQNILKDLLNTGIKPETIASELINCTISQPNSAVLPLLARLPDVQAPFPEAKLLLALLENQPPITPEAKSTPEIEPKSDQKPDPKPASEPAPKQPASTQPFDWDNFLEAIRSEKHEAIYLQLQKSEHEFDGETLHIYPLQKFAERVLKKPENSQILTSTLNGTAALLVHSVEDHKSPKDPSLSQISAIMGDVREIKGDMPF